MIIALSTVMDALWNWVKVATGLPDASILWAEQVEEGGQNAVAPPAPPAQWASLRIRGISLVGQPWVATQPNSASNGHDGAELTFTSTAPLTATFEVRVFRGNLNTSTALAAGLLTAYRLPSVADALRAAGVGIGPIDGPTAQDGYVGAAKVFEPRASVDATIHLIGTVSETGTYIQHVVISDQIDGSTIRIDGPTLNPGS